MERVENFEIIPYWLQGYDIVNFGDYLTELVLNYGFKRAKTNLELSIDPSCRIVAYRCIGSIIDPVNMGLDRDRFVRDPTDRMVYWGCGARDFEKLPDDLLEPVVFSSVRGPLTRDVLRLPRATALGDPGFLIPLLFPQKHGDAATKRSVVVPHYFDTRPRPDILSSTGCDDVIEVRMPADGEAAQDLIRRIAQASFVLSASLHAAIIACAYGVPFAFWSSGHPIDVPFKWVDFAASIDFDVFFAATLDEGVRHYDHAKARIVIPDLNGIVESSPFVAQDFLRERAREI